MLTGKHDINGLRLISNNKRKGILSLGHAKLFFVFCFFIVGIAAFSITFFGYTLLEPTACSLELWGQVVVTGTLHNNSCIQAIKVWHENAQLRMLNPFFPNTLQLRQVS